MKYNFLQFIKGLFIGSGAILPGVSSGVFCVIFGIYENLVNSVLTLFSNFKKNFTFLFPIFLGVIVGIVLFGNILRFFFHNFYMQTCFCIIGFIIGGIPCLLKKNTQKTNTSSIITLLLTLFFSLYLTALESTTFNNTLATTSYTHLIIAGFFMSAGIVIPGISSTVILMLFGIYNIYLDAISCINITILIPISIGALIGCFTFLKIIQLLLKYCPQHTYYAITGFTLGAIWVIFPGFNLGLNGFISILLLIGSLYLSYKLSLKST